MNDGEAAVKAAFEALTEEEKRTLIGAMKMLSVLSLTTIMSDVADRNATATVVAVRTLARLLDGARTVNHELAEKLVVICEAAHLNPKVSA